MLEKIGGESAGAQTYLPNGKLPLETEYEYQPVDELGLEWSCMWYKKVMPASEHVSFMIVKITSIENSRNRR